MLTEMKAQRDLIFQARSLFRPRLITVGRFLDTMERHADVYGWQTTFNELRAVLLDLNSATEVEG